MALELLLLVTVRSSVRDLHPHLLLNYQFCRYAKLASVSKPVCKPPLASFISAPTNCGDDSVLLSHCWVLTDDLPSLQHHEQSEQKLSCQKEVVCSLQNG